MMVKPKTDPATGETTAVLTESDRKVLARARDAALAVFMFDHGLKAAAAMAADGIRDLLGDYRDDPSPSVGDDLTQIVETDAAPTRGQKGGK